MVRNLEQLREQIGDEVPYIDVKPYSHNIISLSLQHISNKYGKAQANKAIADFNLEKHGWKKEPVTKVIRKRKDGVVQTYRKRRR